jgi:LacI family transcriptional regulator
MVKVAQIAGVSIATVSRVVNRHPHVSGATVKAVDDAMIAAGYVPPVQRAAGKSTQRGPGIRTGQIAVLFPDISRSALQTALTGRLLHGIEEALQRRSLTMIVTGLSESGAVPACIEKRAVDGVIFRNAAQPGKEANLPFPLPCVWMFQSSPTLNACQDRVLEDNRRIGELAADWLLARGHRRLVFVNFVAGHPSFHVRRIFFQELARRSNASVSVFEGSLAREAEISLDEMMKGPDAPTGIFVPGRDDEVMATYRALLKLGLRLGEDFDLISCNNDVHRLRTLEPRLPNIDIRPESIGRSAVELLLWRISHPSDAACGMLIAPSLDEATV